MGDYALGEIYLIETLVRTLKYSQRYNYVLMKSQVLPIHCLSREWIIDFCKYLKNDFVEIYYI